MNTLESFSFFYRKSFVRAYADFVALALKKPRQVLNEESNALSHLAQFQNVDLTTKERQENLDRATNHIKRVTIDLHKLTWAELRTKLDLLIGDDQRRLCFNLTEAEVLNRYEKFILAGRDARQFEVQSIGVDTEGTIKMYDDANEIGFNLFKEVDRVKVERITSLNGVVRTREFLFGVLASIVAAGIISAVAFLF